MATTFDALFYDIGEHGEHLLRWHPTPQEVIAKQVREAIQHDRDGKIRQALIVMGWTPPKDDPHL